MSGQNFQFTNFLVFGISLTKKKYAIIYMYFFKEKTWQFKKHLKRKISQERGAQRPDSMNSEKKLKWVDLVEPLL